MDGRRARSLLTRQRLIDAVLQAAEAQELLDAGRVADRAQASRRSLFRLFGDLRTLRIAAVESMLDAPRERLEGDAISSYVTQCVIMYRMLGPLLDEGCEQVAKWQDAMIRLHFGDDRYALQVHGVAALSSWRAWRSLREDRGCSEAQVLRILEIGLARLLR
jgi:AcrR family transcriptional regulator